MRIVDCVSIVVLALACSGSSSPIVEPTTPQGFEAVHFDAMLGSACAAATSRCAFLSQFAIPPAFGATATPVTIDTGTGPFIWQAFVYDSVDTHAAGGTVETLTLMVFSDTNVAAGVRLNPDERLSDTTNVEPIGSTELSDSAGAVTGPCAPPPTLRHTSLPSITSGSCHLRLFSVGLTLTVGSNGTVFSMAPENVDGVRVTY